MTEILFEVWSIRDYPPQSGVPRGWIEMASRARSATVEKGDIFFFYRPKVGEEEAREREDVQRFFMALSPETPGREVYRLFVIGRKHLPEVGKGEAKGGQRNWALNVLTASDPERLREELLSDEYPTETRGERRVGPATPVGEGKYQIVSHEGTHGTAIPFLQQCLRERPFSLDEPSTLRGHRDCSNRCYPGMRLTT
jgi:hypothetical protein